LTLKALTLKALTLKNLMLKNSITDPHPPPALTQTETWRSMNTLAACPANDPSLATAAGSL